MRCRALLQVSMEASVEADPKGPLSHEAEQATKTLQDKTVYDDNLFYDYSHLGGAQAGDEDDAAAMAGKQRLRDQADTGVRDRFAGFDDDDYYDRYIGQFAGARRHFRAFSNCDAAQPHDACSNSLRLHVLITTPVMRHMSGGQRRALTRAGCCRRSRLGV